MANSQQLKIVDSHHHLWQLKRADYHWLTPDLVALYQDFTEQDYKLAAQGVNIEKNVVIQAADTDAETDYLLSLAASGEVSGVVGWIDFETATDLVLSRLDSLSKNSAFKGVRPMLQDIKDVNWILNTAFEPVFHHLDKLNLSFDALVRTEHLAAITKLAKQYPNLKMVINHCAKPNIEDREYILWAEAISPFACLKNVVIKVSGLTLEAGAEQQSVQHFEKYFSHIYQTFGVNRMMWGSDWPVLNLKSNYSHWLQICESLVKHLNPREQQAFWSGTATEFYQLGE